MKSVHQIILLAALTVTGSVFVQSCNNDGEDMGSLKPPREESQLSYFPFSGNMKDVAGAHSPAAKSVKNLTYGTDRFGREASAGEFDGMTTLVEIPNGELFMQDKDLTLSFWMKADATKDGQFVMGLAGWKGFYFDIASDWSHVKLATQYALSGTKSDSEDIVFAGTGLTKDNGGWQGYTFQKEVVGGVGDVYLKNKWVHIVCTYAAATRLSTMYFNGEKVMQTDFNLWPKDSPKVNTTGVVYKGKLTEGGNTLALGFIQGSMNRSLLEDWANPADLYSNHFKGLLDDLRIFKVALTEAEVAKLYADEKV